MGLLDGWRFCPLCAGPLRAGPGKATCERCGKDVWANAVPGAQAVVELDGRILLGRRRDEPGAGRWDIPGGFIEEYEHPLDALRRELREETGLEIEPTEFLGIWMQPYDERNVLSLTWLARPVGGEEHAGDDLTELRWFSPRELPGPDDFAFESYAPILSLWRSRHEHA